MKKLSFLLILSFIMFSFQYTYQPPPPPRYDFYCSALCPQPGSNCTHWAMRYNVDCGGKIEKFVAVWFLGSRIVNFDTHNTRPGFIGIFPPNLSSNCNTNYCSLHDNKEEDF